MSAALDRALNACPSCARQYDVTHLSTGDRVRCECGARFAVERRTPHSPKALRCTSCGGNLELEAVRCGYCRAEITLEDRGLSAVCPGCFARLPRRARHCLECGLAIQPQALHALREGTRCPACKGALRSRGVAELSLVECAGCAGLWIAPSVLAGLVERADASELAERVLAGLPGPAVAAQSAIRYRPCLQCGELMNRKNFGAASGVIVDVCKDHGVWLDHGELEGILAFVRRGGLDRARQLELERLKEEEQRLRERIEREQGDLARGWSREPEPQGVRGLYDFLADLMRRAN